MNRNIRNKKENITEMKNGFNGFTSRPDRARVRVKTSELEDRLIEIIPTKTQREIKVEKGHTYRNGRHL